MGLAAGQARLLTITGRKSDCEFQSMGLSHQKIALARELADLSNEYQNSLNQTKLVYDYYGTGDTSMQLSYGILMNPSSLNNYMPTIVTNSSNKVVLNHRLAAAAAAAGIPHEGLGTLPSENVRNLFINELANQNQMTLSMAKTITSLPYNQSAGLGGGATVVTQTQEMTLDKIIGLLKNSGTVVDFDSDSAFEDKKCWKYRVITSNSSDGFHDLSKNDKYLVWGGVRGENSNKVWHNASTITRDYTSTPLTIGDMLEDALNGQTYFILAGGDGNHNNTTSNGGIVDTLCNCHFWDQMFNTFEELFDDGSNMAKMALDYARTEIEKRLTNPSAVAAASGDSNAVTNYNNTWISISGDYRFSDSTGSPTGKNDFQNAARFTRYEESSRISTENWVMANRDALGYVVCLNTDNDGSSDNDGSASTAGINASNILLAYLTYFKDFMNGISKTDLNGKQVYDVVSTFDVKKNQTKNSINDSTLVKGKTTFNVKTGSEVSSDDLGQATFYDTLFNQICINGWTENDEINDNEYLQKMLQNGMMYVSRQKDDGFYYQNNYSTDTYIKEIADETLIAVAESRYNTEKAKLNAKEQVIDLKMKNIDTEISSLTTEYDTIKNTLSKNIEKSFKRYSA